MINHRIGGERSESVPAHWLKELVSLEQAETSMNARENAIKQVLWQNPYRPKHTGPSEWDISWQAFRNSYQPGDELWRYESEYGPLSGESGYAIVRNGQIIHSIITMIS